MNYNLVVDQRIRKWMVYFFVLGCFLFGMGCGNANTNDALNAYKHKGINQLANTSTQHIETLNEASNQTQLEHKSLIDTLMQSTAQSMQGKQKPQGADGAVLFVSFSMPESLLYALADEAALYDIPVVINGLVDSDFKKTIETFKRLNQEAEQQHLHFKGVSIDPVWFTQFQIQSVPALVVTERAKNCGLKETCLNQPFDVVYGNASLKKALELISKKGDVGAQRAKAILESADV